jgi:general secretion pathway protein A
MSYYQFWGLDRDPFGTTPDPDMFYKTLGHEDCYERLKLAILLKRGLSVVLGDVGYGKTTIKVALLQELQRDPSFEIAVINNPRDCPSDFQFLRAVLREFRLPPVGRTGLDLSTQFLEFLQQKYTERKTVLLVIDEGQNLTTSYLEMIRSWLSFETPSEKLINIAIFAQNELEPRIVRKRNLAQRVAMDHKLNPLNRRDTEGLICYRMRAAGLPDGTTVFTDAAVDAIYNTSHGVPRVITNTCADVLIEAVFQKQRLVDADLVQAVAERKLFRGVPSSEPGDTRSEAESEAEHG